MTETVEAPHQESVAEVIAPPPAPPPPNYGDRATVEKFATTLLELRDICTAAILLPWQGSEAAPPGILAPVADHKTATLDPKSVLEATSRCPLVIVVCSFEVPSEEAAARRILPQFTASNRVSVFLAQLLPSTLLPGRETNDLIMRRYDAMLATGVDDVLLNPSTNLQVLRRTIMDAKSALELNLYRQRLILDANPDVAPAEKLRSVQDRHRKLLWESVPEILMPHFPKLNWGLKEAGNCIGKYRLVKSFATNRGTVLQAVDDQHRACVVKVIDKQKVCTPGELEGVYREFRFLNDIMRHPNIVRAIDLLHSPHRVYLVFEFAGNINMAQLLAERPGECLYEDEVQLSFEQIVRSVAYCHSKEIAHRAVSLEHLVVVVLAGSQRYHVRLVDFHHVIIVKGDATSRTVVGNMPCIAPEVALRGPYLPFAADCWSVGAVLLEMAGGRGSMAHCAETVLSQEKASVAGGKQLEALELSALALQRFFSVRGSHQKALTALNGVDSSVTLQRIQQLLQPNPTTREPLRTLLPDPPPAEGQPLPAGNPGG